MLLIFRPPTRDQHTNDDFNDRSNERRKLNVRHFTVSSLHFSVPFSHVFSTPLQYRRTRLLSFLDHVEIELKEARGGSLWENGKGGGNRYLSYLPQCNVLICLDVVLLSTQGAKSGSQKNHHTQNKKNTQNTKNKKEQGGVVDRSKGVYVGTAHQSKGLEWKVVFVVGMHDGESFFCVFVFCCPMYRPSD